MKASFLLAVLLAVSGVSVAGPLKEAQASYLTITDIWGSFSCGATKVDERTAVTAEHCVDSAFLLQGQVPEEVILDNHEHALVIVAKPLPGKAAKMAHRYPTIGEPIYIWGSPLGEGPLWREGYYQGKIELEEMLPSTWRIGSIFVAPGDSGSGIFDKHGRLVGSVSIGFMATHLRDWSPVGWHEYKFTAEQWREAK